MALQLEDFLITGRTFDEYTAMFDLDIEALRGKKILDCPSGASGFVAEALRHDIDAHGCDIIYGFEPAHVIKQAHVTTEKIYEDTDWMAGHNLTFYGDIAGHRGCRERAVAAFAADFPSPRYRREVLPKLSYIDNSFDLLLSSHLLFVYDDRLDLDFHLASVTEMLRVAREMRLFPLVDFTNSRRDETYNFSPLVYELMEHFSTEIIPVWLEFQPGAGAMLRLRR